MTRLKKCIAIKAATWVAAVAVLMSAAAAYAAPVGSVLQVNGPLFAQKADGVKKILSVKSPVEQGDTLVTGNKTYAQIRFTDNSEITLKPDSQFKIDSFSFEPEKKENDSALFSLIKGGLREVTGLLGKRSKERFGLTTPTATIGIRGTVFDAEYVSPANEGNAGAVPVPAPTDNRPPGLYVQVLEGMIQVTNPAGQQNFAVGQFGYVPSLTQPPVILPHNPGMQFFPPPTFSSFSLETGDQNQSAGDSTVDCEVR